MVTSPPVGPWTDNPSADLVALPILDWPPRARQIALELGRSAAFVEAMQHCAGSKRDWLAARVNEILVKPEELSARLAPTVVLGSQSDSEPSFTFREV